MNPDEPTDPVDDLLAAAYALDGPDANRALYARWAATYDSGFIVQSGYRYHEHVALVFVEHCLEGVAPGDVVVDLGCGTGLAGAAIRHQRELLIDGIDISAEMLREAAEKRRGTELVYRGLVEADLTGRLPVEDDTYAAACSVGTFTHGHVGPDAIHEVVRIVRPGGRIALGINAAHFAAAGFEDTLARLVGDGLIGELRLIDVPIYEGTDMTDPDDVAYVAVFTVSGAPIAG